MKTLWPTVLWSVLLSLAMVAGCAERQHDQVLWPEIEPYETGYLQVSELHQIYYELSGNPQGEPVFVLHGGPGGSVDLLVVV